VVISISQYLWVDRETAGVTRPVAVLSNGQVLEGEVEYNRPSYGAGATLAGGWKAWFLTVDANWTTGDIVSKDGGQVGDDRKWKHVVIPLLAILALWLMRGEPDESARWSVGIVISAVLVVAYVAEEIVWIAQNRGRPCSNCGQRIQLKPFRVRIRCPHCGQVIE
jgi:hypothetical protein